MKKCSFCAEEIQDDAIKCRFCGEMLDKPGRPKWYFSTSVIVIAILCVGPFALPLVWFNPRYKPSTKIAVTVIAIAFTTLLMWLCDLVYSRLTEQIKSLGIY